MLPRDKPDTDSQSAGNVPILQRQLGEPWWMTRRILFLYLSRFPLVLLFSFRTKLSSFSDAFAPQRFYIGYTYYKPFSLVLCLVYTCRSSVGRSCTAVSIYMLRLIIFVLRLFRSLIIPFLVLFRPRLYTYYLSRFCVGRSLFPTTLSAAISEWCALVLYKL